MGNPEKKATLGHDNNDNNYFVNQNHRYFDDAREIFVRIRVCFH
jgi:hypothetical protein